MNIGIFTETYYPQINGVVTSIRALEKELNNQGHKVYIFTTTYPNVDPKPRVFRLPSMPFWSMPSHRVAFSFSPKVLKIIKDLNLDIIHTQTEFSMGLLGKTSSKFFNIPIVHTYHTMYEDYVHYILKGYVVTPKMAKEFSKIFCNTAEAVIAPSQRVYSVLREYGVNREIEIIPTGINLEPFNKSNINQQDINLLKQKFNLNNCPIVLFVGRLGKEKSIDVIIKAMPSLLKKLNNAKLLIVGDGPFKSQLEELVLELNLYNSVIFAGQYPWVDIPKFYQIGDVFVTASTTETQGLTYAEAMAAQIPVIAKNATNIEGLLKDNINGRVFNSDSDLSDILYQVLTNKNYSQSLVLEAYKDIQPFSSYNFGVKVFNLYNKVIEYHKSKKTYNFIPRIKKLGEPLKPIIRFKKTPIKVASLKKVKKVSIKRTFPFNYKNNK